MCKLLFERLKIKYGVMKFPRQKMHSKILSKKEMRNVVKCGNVKKTTGTLAKQVKLGFTRACRGKKELGKNV